MKQETKKTTIEKMNEWLNDHISLVPFVQKMLFVHNLYIMTKAGLSLIDSLRILSEQISNKRLKVIIAEIKAQVEKGRQLSEALSDFPKIFPPLSVSMIAAGETAGKLEESLMHVNNQMKKSRELSSSIRGALIYPAGVIIAMAGIGVEMVAFVLPKIIVMFNDFNAELPLPTKILVAVVNFTSEYGIFVFMGLVALIVTAVWLERKPKIKRLVHNFNLHLPIFGAIIKKINLASFTMTLSSLLKSTIPIIDAVRISATVQSNVVYKENLMAVSEQLKKGISLSETLGKFPFTFTPMVVQMIMVGEQSGQVEQMLAELSEYHSAEVDSTMKNFSTIIEPVIILMLGLAVAGIAVAVIMPMYSLAQSF